MTLPCTTVFLVEVDDTLLDNDRIQPDLKDYLERVHGVDTRDRHWRFLEDLFVELGYQFRAYPAADIIPPKPKFAVAIHRKLNLLNHLKRNSLAKSVHVIGRADVHKSSDLCFDSKLCRSELRV